MPQPEPRAAAARQPKLDTDLSKLIDRRIADNQSFLLTVMGEALNELLATERKAAKDELNDTLRSLRIELAEAQTTIAELRRLFADERASKGITDLPNPLARHLETKFQIRQIVGFEPSNVSRERLGDLREKKVKIFHL